MNQKLLSYSENGLFKSFLFNNKRNKVILILSGISIIIQFVIFKYLYPYASFIHGDSFSYLLAAHYNLDVNTYMVGYSRFLRLFSVFTRSDTALVAFQYFLIQSSMLFLLFTLFYFYSIRRFVQVILLSFMVLNPLFLHLGNLISSDGIFLSLSLIWFGLLLWLIHKPSVQIIIIHAAVLFLAFTVRYNALIYPFISGIAFFISRLPLRRKVLGLGMAVTLCGLFVIYTSYKYKKLTGYWQYSPFSGWQLANNAMYAYRYVDSAKRKDVPKKFQALDNMIRQYFDSTRDVRRYPVESLMASTVYMWSPGLPLFVYRNGLFKKNDTTAKELKKWASMGPFYKKYGLYIIKNYPIHFLKYFVWYNAMKYYAPPVEFLERYNSGNNTVTKETKDWFDYKSTKVSTRLKSKRVIVLSFYPIFSGILNVVMLCSIVCYIILKGWKVNNNIRIGILMGTIIWFLNAGFTIFASSAALRFQSFPLLLTTIFATLLIEWLWTETNTKIERHNPLNTSSNNTQLQSAMVSNI